MGVLDKWLRGSTSFDRNRKPTPSRPTSTIGSTVIQRQSTPVRPSSPRPAVPLKKPAAPPAPKPTVTQAPKPTVAQTPNQTVTQAPKTPVSAPVAPVASVPAVPAKAFDDGLQKKLNRYFERLRAVYPDGVITRLNTGQKKLAERGAQLRKLCGMENELDAFFALGGFTYERTAGGRPRAVSSATARGALVNEVKTLFPSGIPSAATLDRVDHALYLRLRSAARLSGTTITAFLNDYELIEKSNEKGEQSL